MIFSGDGMGPLAIGADDTIVYDPTGQELDADTAAQLCDFNTVG